MLSLRHYACGVNSQKWVGAHVETLRRKLARNGWTFYAIGFMLFLATNCNIPVVRENEKIYITMIVWRTRRQFRNSYIKRRGYFQRPKIFTDIFDLFVCR
jgi:hypothetical protein